MTRTRRDGKAKRVTRIGLKGTREMLDTIFEDVHAKRLDSFANAAAPAR
jgi:hypothetical protein